MRLALLGEARGRNIEVWFNRIRNGQLRLRSRPRGCVGTVGKLPVAATVERLAETV